MSDDDDDMFGDGNESDDTADLFAQANTAKASGSSSGSKKPAAAAAAKKKKSKDEGDDLFDSDSDDDDDDNDAPAAKKPKAKPQKFLSKKEKLEALAKKKRQDEGGPPREKRSSKKKDKPEGAGAADGEQKDGYESGDSIDSEQIERTADDDNFIDTTGEDEEAIKELYAKQRFDEEEEDMEDNGKKRKYSSRYDEAIEDGKEPDNPIEAAVFRLKKKKREKKSTLELEDEAKEFVNRMEAAAEQDEEAIAARRPGLKKLQMLNEVLDMVKKQDYQTYLIDADLLTVVRRWVQPLPNGQLGNVTVRQKLLEAIAHMPGIHPNALKRSELGKTVMLLHKHPKETPAMKRQTRNLIEQWSRGIFQKSGNMQDLEHVHHSRGEGSLASYNRQQHAAAAAASGSTLNARARRDNPGDLKSIISSGKRGGQEGPASANRVRVPFSKGFAFSVRPTAKASHDAGGDQHPQRRSPAKESRGGLAKRMIEKNRKVSKNQRSANISVEGRTTKP